MKKKRPGKKKLKLHGRLGGRKNRIIVGVFALLCVFGTGLFAHVRTRQKPTNPDTVGIASLSAARPSREYTFAQGRLISTEEETPPQLETIGVYNPSNANFLLRFTNTQGAADLSFPYGVVGWTPVVGDWNGDGIDTAGIYDPATATFYLKNSNSAGSADLVFLYGPAGAGWQPIAGDWNGDGIESIGLYNPATGTFYLKNSNSAGAADYTFTFGVGGSGWLPIVGDWNWDGVDTVGVQSD